MQELMARDASGHDTQPRVPTREPCVGVLCYSLDPPHSKLFNRMAQMPGVRVKLFPLVFHPYVEPEPQYEFRPTSFRGRFLAIHNKRLDYPDVQLFSLSLGTVWTLARESDVVVLWGIHSIPAILSAVLAWVRRKPIITCCMMLPPQVELERPRLLRWLKKFVFHLTTSFVSESRTTRQTLDQVYRIPAEKIVDAPFATAGLWFKQLCLESRANREATRRSWGVAENDCVFLFAGSLNRLKGVDVLLEALALLGPEGRKAKVVIVGADGAAPHGCRATLEAQAAERGIATHVRFLGRLPTEEWVAAYKAADVFVFPTRRDMWGKVLVEAAIAGLPLITTDVCAAAGDVVRDQVNGFVIPVNSPQELAAAMRKLLIPELRAQVGARAREIAEQYIDAEAETRGYHQAFARALAGRYVGDHR